MESERSVAILNEFYTAAESERQRYDLVFPKNAKGDLGLVLCIHGGGWVQGQKDEYTSSLFPLSDGKGVAAACINYRYVSETVTFDDELDDVTSALAAIKAKGGEYGVNFTRVLLTGISAGGHLSLLYAYARKATAPIRPVCVVSLCGPTDLSDPFFYSIRNRVGASVGVEYFREIISHGVGFDIDLNDLHAADHALTRYSPIRYADADTVPTVFGHGEIDDIVPYQNALDLDAKLTALGVEHTFISFPHSNHECEDKASRSRIMRLFFASVDRYLKPFPLSGRSHLN